MPTARTRRSAQPTLDDLHLAAWRALLKAHAAALGRIERDLGRAGGDDVVPLTWYDVLIELYDAPGHALRQRDLARLVVLTRSGISRLVDRLEAAGLVQRTPTAGDRRGELIVLTDAGRRALRRTWSPYARAIAQHFAAFVTPDEARVLAATLARVHSAAAEEDGAG